MTVRTTIKRLAKLSAVVIACGGAVAVPPAQGAFGLSAFDGAVLNSAGEAETQAGGHPESASASFSLVKRVVNGVPYPDGGELKETIVELPPGFVGNPTAVDRCPKHLTFPAGSETVDDGGLQKLCPASSIVGQAEITVIFIASPKVLYAPVYNLEPPPGVAAQFGFSITDQRTYIDAMVRNDGDYGVTIRSRNLSQAVPVLDATVTLWGVPADSRHDSQRCFILVTPFCDPDNPDPLWRPVPSTDPPQAFISNPTRCTPNGVGLETRMLVKSWVPGGEDRASFMSHHPPGFPLSPLEWGAEVGPEGCERLAFQPSLAADPDTSRPDAPSGLEVELTMPQESITNPTGLTAAHLRRASVTLPEGMTVNPSSAGGLDACSDEQLGIGQGRPAQCPEGSKIGTVTARTPLLEETLEGSVFVGSQRSDDPESGEMFRIFLSLNSAERGVAVKLRGKVRADAETGRLETVFDDNPQVPVSDIKVRLKSGGRAPLATPTTCGSKLVEAGMGSWAGHDRALTHSLGIDCPGASGFSPSFEAGATRPTAGTFSPFMVHIERPDRQENVDGLSVELPKGSLARLKGVVLCPDADADAGTCSKSSRVGSASVAAGAGSTPFYLKGQPVYLAGPYKGAPYSLSVATRAKAGPFDLGPVVVRQALHVDRDDGHVTVISDPVPTIVKGVPLRLRAIHAVIDRPGFALTPTSCAEKQVKATLHSLQGSTSAAASRFQVGECAGLAFAPRLALGLTGPRQTTTGKHPGVRARVDQTGIGEAGIARARVVLPKSLALDPDNAQALCEFEDGTKPDLENHCPKGSIVGRARAVTPLLEEPLSGNVYFVKNVRRSSSGNLIRTLPMIVVALRGKIAINLKGESSTTRGGLLVNTFANVPDAPITRFNLNINGGSNGILTVTRTRASRINLCVKPRGHIADVQMDGHNGKQADFRTRVKTPCARKSGKAGKAKRSAKRQASRG